MQQVAERLIRVLAMDLIGALDAQVERRRPLRRKCDADVVIVAHLGRLRVRRIRAALTLTRER